MTTATPGSAALLAKRCQEILDWKSSGLLVDGELRKMAASLENVHDGYRLTVAENQTATEAMQEVARLAAKPDEDGVREAIIALVEKSMRDTWMEICSDTECHPDDIEHGRGKVLSFEPKHWARFTGEAVADALSTTGHPKP